MACGRWRWRFLLLLAPAGTGLFLFWKPSLEQGQDKFSSQVPDDVVEALESHAEAAEVEQQEEEEVLAEVQKLASAVPESPPSDEPPGGSLETAETAQPEAAELPLPISSVSPLPSFTPEAWFLQDPKVEPPGFAAFRKQIEAVQAKGFANPDSVRWIVFSGFNGLGNWMLGVSSALLAAGVTGRAFAVLEGPDVCTWMDSPLCAWTKEAPPKIVEAAESRLKKKPSKKITGQVDLLPVYWKGCSWQKLRCANKYGGDVSNKGILVFMSGAWGGEVLLQNPVFAPKLRKAFERRLPAGVGRDERVILDIYAPLSRWIFSPSAAVLKDMNTYAMDAGLSMPGVMSICIQGRWGTGSELSAAATCVDALLAEPWWPKENKTVLHVASMKESFRKKVRERYSAQKITASWPDWDAHVKGQKDDAAAYKDMILAGRCTFAVLPNGGSTFTYASTAMYHTVAIRDAGAGKNTCHGLPQLPYEKLFPEPRVQLDKKCSKKDGVYGKNC